MTLHRAINEAFESYEENGDVFEWTAKECRNELANALIKVLEALPTELIQGMVTPIEIVAKIDIDEAIELIRKKI